MQIRKRNNQLVPFDLTKIERAIGLALGESNETIEWNAYEQLLAVIQGNIKDQMSVEDVSDIVERKLMEFGLRDVAKRYMNHRDEMKGVEKHGWKMTQLQRDIYDQKYRHNGESFQDFLNRVSGGNEAVKKLMKHKKFLPAGRILANRKLHEDGKKITLSNCYVISPPEDNLESIFDVAKKLARTYSYGGGCGVDIGRLRPSGSVVNNNALTTSGATSFMELYSTTTGIIGQKGRRGALMISLPCTHPDLEAFIDIKNDLNAVTKANISIRFTDDFLRAVEYGAYYELKFTVEDTGEVISKIVDARDVFMKFVANNWEMAEPGALFWDRIENWSFLSEDSDFEYAGVNPCAEEPLPPGGSCLLASINLAEFVKNPFTKDATINVDELAEAVKNGVIYLNEVLDEGLPLHPLTEQQISVGDWRQIGLGIMGLADLLIKLGVEYGSAKSLEISEYLGWLILNRATETSALLAKENGTYPKYNAQAVMSSPFFKENISENVKKLVAEHGLRNSQLLTIAPTGSLSTMWGISGGIEPIFQISYTRNTKTLNGGKDSYYKVFTPIAEEYMKYHGIEREEDLPEFFITTSKLDYKKRILMQAVWQKYIDASISSTVNLPKETTKEQVLDLYLDAWRKGLKGVTIYRDGCKRAGILITEDTKTDVPDPKQMTVPQLKELMDKKILESVLNNPNQCPMCGGEMMHANGCHECVDCAYSPCAI